MNLWAALITITALFSFVNFRYIRLPTTIGVMLIALVVSLGLIGLGHLGVGFEKQAASLLKSVHLDEAILRGMLSFLLFAGALHINLNELREQRLVISVLALIGVLYSTATFGTGIYFALHWVGLALDYSFCLLFGALVSPTDPIAVLGMLKHSNVPSRLKIKIAGESLFNDGIGVVAFILLSDAALEGTKISLGHIGSLFLQEAFGGAAFGLAVGWIAYVMLKSVDNYQVEVLLTLALVSGGYALAEALGVSGPIAIVVAGVLIGNHGRSFAMSVTTREHLDTFWELIDEILNAVLFVLIGLEVLVLSFSGRLLLAGLAAIPVLLVARWISVAVPISLMRPWCQFSPGAIRILTWGGLRGGLSVAMALSLPPSDERELIVAITYILVVFSILVQGLTFNRLVRHLYR